MKTKTLFLILLALMFTEPINARTGGEVYKFYKNLDYDFFFDKLEVSFDICKCEIETTEQWLAGFKYTLVEPIGFIESSITPMHFVGLDIKTADAKKLNRKQGTSRKGDDTTTFRHAHFVIFPVLGYTLGLDPNKYSSQEYRDLVDKKITAGVSNALPQIKEKIAELGLTNRSFYVYILPFDDAEDDKKSIMKNVMREGENDA